MRYHWGLGVGHLYAHGMSDIILSLPTILIILSDNPELSSSSIRDNNQADSDDEPNNSDLNADRSPIGRDTDSDSDHIDSDFETEDSDHDEELDEELELEQVATEDSSDGFDSNVFHNFKF